MSGPKSTSGNIPYTTSQPITSTPPEKPNDSGVNSLDGQRYTQKPETTPTEASIHTRTAKEQKGVSPTVNREKTVADLQSAYKARNAEAGSKRDLLDLVNSLTEIRHYLDNPALASQCNSYSILWIPDEGEPISVIPPGMELKDRTKASEIKGMLHKQIDKLDQKFTASKLQKLKEEIAQQESLVQVAAQELANLGALLPVLPPRQRIVMIGDPSGKVKQPTPQHGTNQPSPETSGVKPAETLPSSNNFETHPEEPDATPLQGKFVLRFKTPDAVRHREPAAGERGGDNVRTNFDKTPSSLDESDDGRSLSDDGRSLSDDGRSLSDDERSLSDDGQSLIDEKETGMSVTDSAEPDNSLLDDPFELPTKHSQPDSKQPKGSWSSEMARARPKSSNPAPDTTGPLPSPSTSPTPAEGVLPPPPPSKTSPSTVNIVSELSLQLNECPASVGNTIDSNIGKLAREVFNSVHPKPNVDQKPDTSPLYMGPLHSARKAMLARAITNFHRKHSRDALAKNRDAMNFTDRVIPVIELGVLSTKPSPQTVMNQNGRLGPWMETQTRLMQKEVPETTASAIATATTGYQSDPKSNLLDAIMEDVELIESKRISAGFDISELNTYRLYPDINARKELKQLCREYYKLLQEQGDLPPPVKKGATPVTKFTLSDKGKSIDLELERELNPGTRKHLESTNDFYERQVNKLKTAAGVPLTDELSSLGRTEKNKLKTFGKLYLYTFPKPKKTDGLQ